MTLCRKKRILKGKLGGICLVLLALFVIAQYQEFSSLSCCSDGQYGGNIRSQQQLSFRLSNLSELYRNPDNQNNISSFKTQSSKVLIQSAVRSVPYIQERLAKHNIACEGKEYVIGREPDRSIPHHFQVSKSHKLIYCSIEKAGTTFWRRVLQVLDSTNLDNPYQIKPMNVNKNSQSLFKEDIFRMMAKLRTHGLFMFVRNPFHRLLSGYLDKLYTANPFYWGLIGREIRSGPVTHHSFERLAMDQRTEKPHAPCYHNITFDEFINYVNEAENTTARRRDPHFMPMYDLCKPCQFQYDFFGKMETFKKDFTFLMEALNISKFDVNGLEEMASDDTFLDVAASLDDRRNEIVKCISMHEAYLRSWKHMQIKGLIGTKENYPFSEKQSQYLTPFQLVHAMKMARNRSTSRDDLKKQKETFFMNIFRTVELEKLSKLVKILKNDFEIFDYEPHPQSVFAYKVRDRLSFSEIFDIYLNEK